MTRRQKKSEDLKKIINNTIAVKELPRAYRTVLTIMRKQITDYILKKP